MEQPRSALRKAGQLTEAVDAIRNALALQPDYAFGHATLGSLERDLGDEAAAEASLRTALRLRPDLRGALVGLAGLLQRQSRLDESAQLYLRAIKLAPAANEWFQLGSVLAERGEPVQARDAFARALAADPMHLRAALGLHLTLPMLYDSAEHIASARAAYTEGLTALEGLVEPCTRNRSASDVLDGWQWSNFLLPYQGLDDKALQQRYAALVARSIDIGRTRSAAAVAAGERCRPPHPGRFCFGILQGRNRRHVLSALDHGLRSFQVRDLRVSPASRHRRARQRDRSERRSLPPSRRPALARGGRGRGDTRRRARCPRLSRARDAFGVVCARGASTRAGAMRRLGASDDDGAPDHRLLPVGCGDGAAGCRRALQRAARPAAGDRHAIFAAGDSRGHRPRALLAAAGQGAAALSAVAVQGASGQRRFAGRGPRGHAGYDARALRGPSPGVDRPLHAPARARVHRARHRDPRARDRVAEPFAPRLSARQPRLRCDGRYAPLVRRQHEPRRARLRAAHRHATRCADARPADGGDARSDRRDGPDRRESRRLRADRGEARHGSPRGGTSSARASGGGRDRLFDDRAPIDRLQAFLQDVAVADVRS